MGGPERQIQLTGAVSTGQAVLGPPYSIGMEQPVPSNGKRCERLSICTAKAIVWQIQADIAPGE